MVTDMMRTGSTTQIVLILLTLLKCGSTNNSTDVVEEPGEQSKSLEPIKFTHKMYPVMLNSQNTLLTLRINRVANCYWTQKGNPRKIRELPYRSKHTQWNRSINAFKLLEQSVVHLDTFTCHCNISMAGRIILFAVEFLAFRSKEMSKLQALYNRTSENMERPMYPLLKSCMTTTAVYNEFYRFYLKSERFTHEEDAPQACFQDQHPLWSNFLIMRMPLKNIQKTVRCDFKGFPRPRVEYFLNGVRETGRVNPIGTNKILLLSKDTMKPVVISCKASNTYGINYITILRFQVQNSILYKDEFRHHTINIPVPLSNLEKDTVLKCPSSSYPSAHFEFSIWLREKLMTTTNLIEYVTNGLSSLTVRNAMELRRWRYFCVTCDVNKCTIVNFIIYHLQDYRKPFLDDQGLLKNQGLDKSLKGNDKAKEDDGKYNKSKEDDNETESEGKTEIGDPEMEEEQLDGWQLGFWVAVGSVIVVSLLLSVMLLMRFLYGGRSPITYQVRMTNVRKSSIDSMRSYSSTPLVQSRRSSHYFLPVCSEESGALSEGPLPTKEHANNDEYYVAMSLNLREANSDNLKEKRFVISPDSLQTIRPLGEGAFGKVTLAKILDGPLIDKLVAIKQLKDSCLDYLNVSSLTHEVQVLKTLGPHPHIIRLLGASTKGRNPFMATEFCSNGSLKNYLHQLRTSNGVGEQHLQGFVRQIAHGMEFLASKQFLHCDLAARNVFLTETFVCKIADFGMARRADQLPIMQANVAVPIRWLAPEVILERKFSLTSDVWSFGVLVWEIYSLGAMPYQGHSTQDICNILTNGYRMTRPELCPLLIWLVVEETWSAESTDRPSFSTIMKRLNIGRRRSSTISYRRRGSIRD